jgi:hypothetical protein
MAATPSAPDVHADPEGARMRLSSQARRAGAAAVAATGVMLAAAVASGPAAAAPAVPGAEPSTIEAPAGEYCPFAIEVTFRDGTKLHKEGSALFSTGPLSVTVENVATGASATFNASGPTFADGTLTGTALIGQPASAHVGPAFLIINRGRVTFTASNTIATIQGSQIDICGRLG